jgi:predicted 2-oxoglutarate/Fe(II)-dependent dioxygenase YbiX/peroxiredoxin
MYEPPSLPLLPGDLAPWFKAPAVGGRPDFAFNSAAGAPILLFFMGSAGHPRIAGALTEVLSAASLFDDVHARFFGVTVDQADVAERRIAPRMPGIRYFMDSDRAVSHLYGAAERGKDAYHAHLLVLDAALNISARFSPASVPAALAHLRDLAERGVGQDWAPVLTVPNLLEPALCSALIELYDRKGGIASGFMQEVGGRTTQVLDRDFKRRSDTAIDDPALRSAVAARISRRLVPAIRRTFQFEATRIERYIVAAYDGGTGGFFRAHRDNTTKGTAHRRFAVTINLNDDFEGGDLRFPEFGTRTYRAPKGGAVVFSCSLLHEATPVTAGRRYACLPFLYDDAAAAIREANNAFLAEDVPGYTQHNATVA